MNFLFPNFLYALGLVAIPVIIHFFNFQRAKRVYFTNVAFLKTVKEATNSRNRIKHLLILLTRMLFIASLVLAFAQPFLPKQQSGAQQQSQSGNFVSIYLDNSYSMQQERDNRSLMNWAVGYAEQLPQAFPKQMRYQIVDNSLQGNSRFFYDGEKLMDKLIGFPYSNEGARLDRIYQKQLKGLEQQTTPQGNHIFWISDFQRQNLPNLGDLAIDTAQKLYLLPLTPNRNTNLYIDSVWLETPFIKVQENNFLNIRISNHGQEDLSDKVVKLFLEGNQVSSGTVSLPAGGQETLKLNFATNQTGNVQGRIALEDYPMVFDNEHYFVLKVAPEIKIVSVVADQSNYIEQVYANEPFFKVRRFSTQSIDYAAFNEADLIVLQGINRIDPSLQVPLAKALEKGSSIALFPGADFDPSGYSTLASIAIQRKEGQERQGLQSPEEEQPFFQGVFEQVSSSMSMPEATPLMEWGNRGASLLRFKTGKPFLSRLKSGKGKVYLFASPLNAQSSNFAKHALFVPTLYKMALSSKTSSERLSYTFGEDVATISLPENTSQQEVFKLKQNDFELIPEQRVADGKLILSLPKGGIDAGVYQLRTTQNETLIGQVAFNYSTEESKLEYYSQEELQKHFEGYPQVTIFDQVEVSRFQQVFAQAYTAQPLWRYFLLTALAFLLAEILLIRIWKG